jgi:hypothetical protein
MALLQINLGNYANDGTGDDLRTAFDKVNKNFASLDTEFTILGGTNIGVGTGVYADRNGVNLEFKTLTSTDSSVTITNTTTTVNLHANTRLASDNTPTLSANLSLAGHNIVGPGDTQTSVFGVSVPNLSFLISMIIESRSVNVDLGTILSPSGKDTNFRGYTLDMGQLVDPTPQLQVNFGTIV